MIQTAIKRVSKNERTITFTGDHSALTAVVTGIDYFPYAEDAVNFALSHLEDLWFMSLENCPKYNQEAIKAIKFTFNKIDQHLCKLANYSAVKIILIYKCYNSHYLDIFTAGDHFVWYYTNNNPYIINRFHFDLPTVYGYLGGKNAHNPNKLFARYQIDLKRQVLIDYQNHGTFKIPVIDDNMFYLGSCGIDWPVHLEQINNQENPAQTLVDYFDLVQSNSYLEEQDLSVTSYKI